MGVTLLTLLDHNVLPNLSKSGVEASHTIILLGFDPGCLVTKTDLAGVNLVDIGSTHVLLTVLENLVDRDRSGGATALRSLSGLALAAH